MGWRGLKDREILERWENHPFDVFITGDKNLPYQQNLASHVITIVVLDSSSTRPDYLVPFMRQVSTRISSLPAGSAVRINDAGDVVSISP
jgi:hypothetical protein